MARTLAAPQIEGIGELGRIVARCLVRQVRSRCMFGPTRGRSRTRAPGTGVTTGLHKPATSRLTPGEAVRVRLGRVRLPGFISQRPQDPHPGPHWGEAVRVHLARMRLPGCRRQEPQEAQQGSYLRTILWCAQVNNEMTSEMGECDAWKRQRIICLVTRAIPSYKIAAIFFRSFLLFSELGARSRWETGAGFIYF